MAEKKVIKKAKTATKKESRIKKQEVSKTEKVIATPKTEKAEVTLRIDLYDAKGALSGKISLPAEIFGAKINDVLLAQAVRVYLANQRQGTVSTKTRGEVNYSTRKIYRQKGTGRARHGGVGAPIFVHGGIAHGPKPADHSMSLPAKMRKSALVSALSAKAKDSEIRVVAGLKDIEQKTKTVALLFKALGQEGKKTTLVTPGKVDNVYKAARNIESLTIMPASQLNTYEVLNGGVLVFMQEAVESLKVAFKG